MSREKFEAWFYAPEQKELRESCAPGWAYRTWQAATASMQSERDHLAAQLADVVAENGALKLKSREVLKESSYVYSHYNSMVEHLDGESIDGQTLHELQELIEEKTPATDRFLAEQRAQAHKEGAHFVANRMLAAWEAGFIEDTAKNAADIARMILTSTEFMADAPEGDFDRSFADGVLEDIAAQLRNEVKV